MWIVLFIVILFFAAGIIWGILNVSNEPDIDKDGRMHCKGCGCADFLTRKNRNGSIIYKCRCCGKRWLQL